jgi:hypothetical protein
MVPPPAAAVARAPDRGDHRGDHDDCGDTDQDDCFHLDRLLMASGAPSPLDADRLGRAPSVSGTTDSEPATSESFEVPLDVA